MSDNSTEAKKKIKHEWFKRVMASNTTETEFVVCYADFDDADENDLSTIPLGYVTEPVDTLEEALKIREARLLRGYDTVAVILKRNVVTSDGDPELTFIHNRRFSESDTSDV